MSFSWRSSQFLFDCLIKQLTDYEFPFCFLSLASVKEFRDDQVTTVVSTLVQRLVD